AAARRPLLPRPDRNLGTVRDTARAGIHRDPRVHRDDRSRLEGNRGHGGRVRAFADHVSSASPVARIATGPCGCLRRLKALRCQPAAGRGREPPPAPPPPRHSGGGRAALTAPASVSAHLVAWCDWPRALATSADSTAALLR